MEKKLSANDILEYVCWLADPEKMYEFALGTCDLDLVAMVAVQTQKVDLKVEIKLTFF